MAAELSGFSLEEVRLVGWSRVYQRLFPDPEYRYSLLGHLEQPAAHESEVRDLKTEIVTPKGDVRRILLNIHALPKSNDGTSRHALFGVDTTTEQQRRGSPPQ